MASEYRSSPDIFSSTAAMLPDQLGSLFKKQQQVGEEQANIVEGAEKKFAEQKGQYGIDVAKAKAAAARGAAGSELGVYKKYEKELMAPAPTIQYTKDTKEGMMSLAALLPMAAAMMGGKGHASALGALQSMSGVLQGHEEGNQARVALEEKNFKEKLDAFNRHQGQIKEAFERSLQMAKLNASAAQAQLEVKLAELNAPLLAAQVKRDGVVSAATRNLAAFDKITGVIETSLSKINQEKGDNYKVNGKDMFLTDSQAKTFAGQGASVQKVGTKGQTSSALLAGRAENIREAFTQVAKDVENMARMPADKSVLGSFAGMTGQSGENLFSALQNTFARNITDSDSRMLQQLVSGLEANMAMALGGGYASSATKARMDMYKQQVPQSGDDGYAVANFLARVRQEMNIVAENFSSKPGASPEMDKAVQNGNDTINKFVPFTVKDVMDAKFAGEAPPKAGVNDKKPDLSTMSDEEILKALGQ